MDNYLLDELILFTSQEIEAHKASKTNAESKQKTLQDESTSLQNKLVYKS